MRAHISILLFICCLSGFAPQVRAAFIERTITVDGDMSDWYDTGAAYTPPGDITSNTGQFSEDAQDGSGNDLDEPLSNTGRDLKKFSFTWDSTNLYFYVERYASESNVTDWWFFIDSTTGGVAGTDPDGFMQDGEKVLRIKWKGANQNTVAEIWDYDAVDNTNGDSLTNAGVGDGYDMPGDVINGAEIYNTDGGASSGVQMESYIPWSSILGLTGPANVRFHISSSNGTNLPNNIIDNMDGPAGGQLFPVDLRVTKTASASSVRGLESFTYTISVFNASIDPFTSVQITDNLPSQITYSDPNYTASTGTYSSGVWTISSIAANTTETLTINVTAGNVPISIDVDNTASLTASTPADENSTNDSSTATVTITPIPLLTIVKNTAGGVTSADSGSELTYQILVTNTGGEAAEKIEITDQISPYERLKIDSGSGSPFTINWNTSGLTGYTATYSADYGADSYTHPLATDPPNTYDDVVTNFKLQMNILETMNVGGSFTIQYKTQVR